MPEVRPFSVAHEPVHFVKFRGFVAGISKFFLTAKFKACIFGQSTGAESEQGEQAKYKTETYHCSRFKSDPVHFNTIKLTKTQIAINQLFTK